MKFIPQAVFKHWFVILPIGLSVIFLTGCKEKGCTDKSALNYNITANKDDGSCIYCEMTSETSEATADIFEENSSSQYYGQAVARVYGNLSINSFNYSSCGLESSCVFYYRVQNLVNNRIDFSFRITDIITYVSFESVTVDAFQTSALDSVVFSAGSSCFPLDQGQFEVTLLSPISYN